MKHVNGEYIVDRCITVRFQPVDSSVLLNIFLYIFILGCCGHLAITYSTYGICNYVVSDT